MAAKLVACGGCQRELAVIPQVWTRTPHRRKRWACPHCETVNIAPLEKAS